MESSMSFNYQYSSKCSKIQTIASQTNKLSRNNKRNYKLAHKKSKITRNKIKSKQLIRRTIQPSHPDLLKLSKQNKSKTFKDMIIIQNLEKLQKLSEEAFQEQCKLINAHASESASIISSQHNESRSMTTTINFSKDKNYSDNLQKDPEVPQQAPTYQTKGFRKYSENEVAKCFESSNIYSNYNWSDFRNFDNNSSNLQSFYKQKKKGPDASSIDFSENLSKKEESSNNFSFDNSIKGKKSCFKKNNQLDDYFLLMDRQSLINLFQENNDQCVSLKKSLYDDTTNDSKFSFSHKLADVNDSTVSSYSFQYELTSTISSSDYEQRLTHSHITCDCLGDNHCSHQNDYLCQRFWENQELISDKKSAPENVFDYHDKTIDAPIKTQFIQDVKFFKSISKQINILKSSQKSKNNHYLKHYSKNQMYLFPAKPHNKLSSHLWNVYNKKKLNQYIKQHQSLFLKPKIYLNPLILYHNEKNTLKKNFFRTNQNESFSKYNFCNKYSSQPHHKQSEGVDHVGDFLKPRPRFAHKIRRKSSLVDMNKCSNYYSNNLPIEIKKCENFENFGICENSINCSKFHFRGKCHKYQSLLKSFINLLNKQMHQQNQSSNPRIENILERFFSMQPGLKVFQNIIFRKPETSIFTDLNIL
jgi:hypothetical protein